MALTIVPTVPVLCERRCDSAPGTSARRAIHSAGASVEEVSMRLTESGACPDTGVLGVRRGEGGGYYAPPNSNLIATGR